MVKKRTILFTEYTDEEIKELVGSSVKSQLIDFKKSLGNLHSNDELLSREEACKFLKINLSTLWHWTQKGKVIAYAISSRRYYKKTELLEALKPIKK